MWMNEGKSMSALGTKKRDVFADAKRNFDHMVTEHEMTVLRDDELYRHIRCRRPGTSLCGWDLITWPGHLVVTGDVESFQFAREADMFGFFEMCGNEHGINPDYWGEKIQGSAKWRTHSPELFTQLVVEHFWERRHSYEGDTAALWRAIREDVLIHAEYAVAARDALMSFQHWDRQAGTFEFSDAWEWSFLDADWHYLRSLHAIVWGIRKYRAAKAQS